MRTDRECAGPRPHCWSRCFWARRWFSLTGGRLGSSAAPLTAAPLACSLESIRQCGVALCIVLGFSILSASIGSSAVRDRVTGAKRLQHISGLGYGTYWFTNFLFDMVGLGRDVPHACTPGIRVCVQVCAHACMRVCKCVYVSVCVRV